VLTLFSEAETKVRKLMVPLAYLSIKELQYVVYHLIRVLDNEKKCEVVQELNKTANYDRRAIYDVSEAQFILLLGKSKKFKVKYRHSFFVTDVFR